jgi:hypothetical protein
MPLARASVWWIRVGALAALISTLWFAGPRAWTVLAHRIDAASTSGATATVALDRVGFRRWPAWLHDHLLVAVMSDLSPRLQGEIAILDEASARDLEQRLSESPWITRVGLRRVFPDRLALDVELRRPVLEVWLSPDGPAHVLVDEDGLCLPAVAGSDLPRIVLSGTGMMDPERLLGTPYPHPQVLPAAKVAVEWRDEIHPRVPSAPSLLEVDAQNLGYRFVGDGRWSEVLVGVARADGGTVYLAYGHPPGSPAPRVPTETKARILSSMLKEFPGLAGIDRGDLRFANRWRDWLRPRPALSEAR